MVDSLAKNLRNLPPAPTDGDEKQTGAEWIRGHQQTIRDLTSAQKGYVEAYHDVRSSTDGQLTYTSQKLDQAFAGVRDEIRQTLYGNTKDEDLTKEQHKAIAHYTMSMVQRLHDIHDFDNQCFKLPKWNVFSLKSERGLLAPPSGFIPRKVLASKLGGGLNQRSP